MDNETRTSLAQQLTGLDAMQLKNVCSNMLFKIEVIEKNIQDDYDIDEMINQEKSILLEIADELKLEPPQAKRERDAVIQLLIVVADGCSEYRQALQNALSELDEQQEALDGGLTVFIMSTLAVAIATAIIRPRVVIELADKTTGGTVEKKTKIVIEARGVKDIAEVVRAALPFLH